MDDISSAWVAAAQEYGLPYNTDFNGAQDQGVGAYHLTIDKKGWRCSAAAAFLRPALKRVNLHLRIRAHVTRVRFDGDLARGVEWVEGGQGHVADAETAVILAAGAVQTPQILQLSGVGPAGFCSSWASRWCTMRPRWVRT